MQEIIFIDLFISIKLLTCGYNWPIHKKKTNPYQKIKTNKIQKIKSKMKSKHVD